MGADPLYDVRWQDDLVAVLQYHRASSDNPAGWLLCPCDVEDETTRDLPFELSGEFYTEQPLDQVKVTVAYWLGKVEGERGGSL